MRRSSATSHARGGAVVVASKSPRASSPQLHQQHHHARRRVLAASVASSDAPPSTSSTSTSSPCPPSSPSASRPALAARVRADFPILDQILEGQRQLVYLDNGATSQKPKQVIEAMDAYYARDNANVHRGVHQLAARATASYENSRSKVAAFINAQSDREVVFTKNATEGVNLVANSWGGKFLRPGDEIAVSELEHHANIVPWQLVAARTGATLRVVPLTRDKSRVDVDALSKMLKESGGKIKIVALAHVSNVLGCVLPAADVAEMCRSAGARLLLDCCQTLPTMPCDVRALGADWIVASAHKACGPTGIGVLWGRGEVLEEMPPFLGGGEMIDTVTLLQGSTFAPPPARFEAGTPAIAEAIGFGAAVDYLSSLGGNGGNGTTTATTTAAAKAGMEAVAAAEEELGGILHEGLAAIDGVTVYGPKFAEGSKSGTGSSSRAALASFNVEGLHATDVSTLLDHAGVAVRSGHHCAQPLHSVLGCNASARASPYFYNTAKEVEVFLEELKGAIKFFRDAGL